MTAVIGRHRGNPDCGVPAFFVVGSVCNPLLKVVNFHLPSHVRVEWLLGRSESGVRAFRRFDPFRTQCARSPYTTPQSYQMCLRLTMPDFFSALETSPKRTHGQEHGPRSKDQGSKKHLTFHSRATESILVLSTKASVFPVQEMVP